MGYLIKNNIVTTEYVLTQSDILNLDNGITVFTANGNYAYVLLSCAIISTTITSPYIGFNTLNLYSGNSNEIIGHFDNNTTALPFDALTVTNLLINFRSNNHVGTVSTVKDTYYLQTDTAPIGGLGNAKVVLTGYIYYPT